MYIIRFGGKFVWKVLKLFEPKIISFWKGTRSRWTMYGWRDSPHILVVHLCKSLSWFEGFEPMLPRLAKAWMASCGTAWSATWAGYKGLGEWAKIKSPNTQTLTPNRYSLTSTKSVAVELNSVGPNTSPNKCHPQKLGDEYCLESIYGLIGNTSTYTGTTVG